MDTGQLVVVSCASPREKFWGVLRSLNTVGATVRVVPLEAFEDFARQLRDHQPMLITPITIFLPSHRLERIELDESGGAVESFGDRLQRLTGLDPLAVLLGSPQSAGSEARM